MSNLSQRPLEMPRVDAAQTSAFSAQGTPLNSTGTASMACAMKPSRRTKICYVIGSLERGGAEGQLAELIRGIDHERFEPILILERDTGSSRVEGFVSELIVLHNDSRRIHSTLRRVQGGTQAFRQFCRHLKEFTPDIVHAFLPVPSILAAGARLLNRAHCVVVSRRSLAECYRPNQRLGALADVIATRAADFVLANSRAIADELVSRDGIDPSRTAVVYNGVDTARFSPLQSKRMREELGWGREHLVFGMIANFFRYKGHLDFVRAARLIYKSVPRARFLLLGQDKGEMPPVQRALEESGLAPYTKIMPETQTPELAFAAMDFYICSSETEGFSNVLLEAMASGLPVIATDVGGNREAVADGVTGFLVPPRAPERLAEVAIQLASHPDQAHRFAEKARSSAEERFSVGRMLRAHEEIYCTLLKIQSRSPWSRIL